MPRSVPPRRPHPVRGAVLAATVVAAALAPVAAGPAALAKEHPGATASDPRSDFTAGVRSIDHGRGIVTLVGTGPVGGSVGITADGVEPVWTEAGSDGSWTAEVRLGPGPHVLHVRSQVTGRTIDVAVELRILLPPEMIATVDGIARTIALEGSGYPGAHLVVREADAVLDEVDVAADGTWSTTLRGLSFGDHHVEVWQYFDGTHNGGVDDVYRVSGAAAVTTATASRETDRTTLAGRAPAGTTLRFADADGPITDDTGAPVEVPVGDDTTWQVTIPIPDDVRFQVVDVTTFDGGRRVGTAEARVTIPIALAGTAEELPDGSVRLAGTGEVGGVVSLEDAEGTPVTDAEGHQVQTQIGRTWELVLPRDVLPDDVVVARQRVGGVEQGALRLVLPRRPGVPGPGGGHGGSGGSGGAVVEPGGRAPAPGRTAASRIRHGDVAGQPDTTRLAYTGADVLAPTVVASALLAAGGGGLVAARLLRGRRSRRG